MDRVRAAGLPVELTIEGTPIELAPGIDLSAYRIVQEALTNALAHAGPATASVRVRYDEDQLALEIADTGVGVRQPDPSGHGLDRDARTGVALRRPARDRRPTRRRVRHPRPVAPDVIVVTIRVVLADDERLVRAGFRMILGAEPDITIVAEAGDGREAVQAVRQHPTDVVLMDIRMPNVDGLEATRRILAGPRDPPRIIVLTTFDLDEYVYEALRAGASGFLLKDAPEERLIAAIRVAADGGSLFAPSVTRRLIERFASATRPSVATDGLGNLTPRETEVLRLIARGLSNGEIAEALVVTEHTAKTHVAHILDKLDLRDRVQAVVLAYESGLVRPGDPD